MVTKKEINKKIGQRIIDIRSKKGLTQAGLANTLGKDRQALEKLENGRVNPTLYTLYEIATALDVSISDLVKF